MNRGHKMRLKGNRAAAAAAAAADADADDDDTCPNRRVTISG